MRPKLRATHLRMAYGLTEEDFDLLWEMQEGGCGICHTTLVAPVVDHDHLTGEVRGLLCKGCNTGLGLLGDTILGIESALQYLRRQRNHG